MTTVLADQLTHLVLQLIGSMSGDSIKVVCRLRPINKIEVANNASECVSYTDKDVVINIGGESKYDFTFDRVFGPATQQIEIYREVAGPVIHSVLGGFNGTIFAYGQTGGGKTWTMEGPNHHDLEYKGLIPRTIEGLFQAISNCEDSLEFVIKCSYIQIYNEKLFDLLDRICGNIQHQRHDLKQRKINIKEYLFKIVRKYVQDQLSKCAKPWTMGRKIDVLLSQE